MATPLLLKTFELNQIIWTKGPYFRFYVEWDPIKMKFCVAPNHKSMRIWLLFGLLPQLALFLNFLFLFIVGLYHPNVIDNFTVNALISIPAFFMVSYGICLSLYLCNLKKANCLYAFCNAVLVFSQRLLDVRVSRSCRQPGLKSILNLFISEVRKMGKFDKSCDKFGITLISILVYFFINPFGVAICFTFLAFIKFRFDPFYITLMNIFPSDFVNSLYSSYAFLFAFCIATAFVFSETTRPSHILVNMLLQCYYIKQMLQKISKIHNEGSPQLAITEYKRLMILETAGESTISYLALITLGFGYGVIVFAASVTILGFRSLPLEIYWAFVLTTIFTTTMLMIGLPNATHCDSFSKDMLKNWYLTGGSGYDKRLLRTLKPICFHFGWFRQLDEESKVIYITSLIENIANGILVLKMLQKCTFCAFDMDL